MLWEDMRLRGARLIGATRAARVAGAFVVAVLVLALPAPAQAGACPSVELIGVRGSGQHEGFGQPLGALVSSVFQQNIAGAHSYTIQYPAVDVRPLEPLYNRNYMTSVTQGINALYGFIVSFQQRCGSTPLLLAGYSQGAEVVDGVLALPMSSKQRASIAGVALFGDPRFNPANGRPPNDGTFNPSFAGISRLQFLPPTGTFGTLVNYSFSDVGRVRSYCAVHDPVCNTSSLGLGLSCLGGCAHFHYTDLKFVPLEGGSAVTYTQAAAAFLVSRFRGFAPPGPDPVPAPGPAPGPGPGPSPGGVGSVVLAQGPAAPAGYRYAITLSGFGANSAVAISCRDSVTAGGFYPFSLSTNASGAAFTQSYCYSGDGPDHWVVAGGVESNHVTWGGGGAPPPPPPPPPPTATFAEQETPNHPVNTFTNYHNASGQGPAIGSGQWVQVTCKVYDPTIQSVNPDGYWYRIATSPWNDAYYAPANTFMNGDPYGGPYTHNTDFGVPNC
jgi:hypothetical protein